MVILLTSWVYISAMVSLLMSWVYISAMVPLLTSWVYISAMVCLLTSWLYISAMVSLLTSWLYINAMVPLLMSWLYISAMVMYTCPVLLSQDPKELVIFFSFFLNFYFLWISHHSSQYHLPPVPLKSAPCTCNLPPETKCKRKPPKQRNKAKTNKPTKAKTLVKTVMCSIGLLVIFLTFSYFFKIKYYFK